MAQIERKKPINTPKHVTKALENDATRILTFKWADHSADLIAQVSIPKVLVVQRSYRTTRADGGQVGPSPTVSLVS